MTKLIGFTLLLLGSLYVNALPKGIDTRNNGNIHIYESRIDDKYLEDDIIYSVGKGFTGTNDYAIVAKKIKTVLKDIDEHKSLGFNVIINRDVLSVYGKKLIDNKYISLTYNGINVLIVVTNPKCDNPVEIKIEDCGYSSRANLICHEKGPAITSRQWRTVSRITIDTFSAFAGNNDYKAIAAAIQLKLNNDSDFGATDGWSVVISDQLKNLLARDLEDNNHVLSYSYEDAHILLFGRNSKCDAPGCRLSHKSP